MTILERFRRRSKATAAALLPLLLGAWLDASAAACAQMLSTDAPSPAAERHAAHDREADADAPPAHGTRHLSGPERAASSRLPGHQAPGSADGSSHDHAACPHCPSLPSAPDLAEVQFLCQAEPSAADHGRSLPVSEPDLKHALPVVGRIAPPDATARPAASVASTAAPLSGRRIPLHVRYCLYLI